MPNDETLQAGIAAAKAGDLSRAVELFKEVVKIDPSSEQGWLGLGYCLPTPEQREYCFRRILALNPNHRIAREQLARLSQPDPLPPPVKQSPFTSYVDDPAPQEVTEAPSFMAFREEAPAPQQTLSPAGSIQTTSSKIARPNQALIKKKKSNRTLVAALVILGVSILAVSVLGIAIFFLYMPLSLPADQPVLSTATITQTQTPRATPSPTPIAPTPIPSRVPTVVYTPLYKSMPCPFDASASVNCGQLIVPEDRTGDASHTIKLAVVVYHTRNKTPAEPVIFLQGGPGGEAVQLSANAYSVLVAPFIAKRDFIAFDQRGTGLSEPALKCDELTKMYVQDIHGAIDASTRDLVYGNAFRSCNGLMLAQGINLRSYTTLESAADVRDLLAVLKYPKANLYGASYGTRLAQVVMREYPGIVKTSILDSVVPVDTSIFSNYSNSMAAGLKTLFTGCAADPQCRTAYPALETMFWDLVKQLDEKPVTVTSSNFPTGTITQTVTGETVINLVLGAIKSSRYIGTVPQFISRFKSGDFSTLVIQQSSLLFAFEGIDPGLFINMTCHEQVLSTTLEEAQTEANRMVIRNYSWLPFYGDIEHVFKTCKSWGAVSPAYGENNPTISDIPSLIITGSYDPTTPPVYAKQIATHLLHNYYFEFPTLGHTPTAADSSGCAMKIVEQFLDDPSTEPDRTCLGELEKPVFVVPYTGDPPLALKAIKLYGIKVNVPKDWQTVGFGFYYRGNSPFDITEVGILRLSLSINNIQDLFSLKAYGYRGLDGPLNPAGERQANGLNWQLYTSSSYGRPVDFALVEVRGGSLGVIQFSNQDEHDALYKTVFLPIVDSVTK